MKTAAETGTKKKLWITGGSGFLGGTLIAFLRPRYDIAFSYNRHPLNLAGAQSFNTDLTSADDVEKVLSKIQPDAVIHCAALTDVDYCETHVEEARKANTEAPKVLAEAAAKRGVHFIHISTEAVYGDSKGPHREDEALKPVNRYAETKVAAEEAVLKAGGKFFIARTGFEGWSLSEASKISFFEWILRKLRQGKSFQVFEDRIFTPFSVYNFVDILDEVVQKKIEGLYNVEGIDAASYLEFAKEIARVFNQDASLMVPAKMEEVLKGLKRPHDTVLDVRKIQKVLTTKILGINEMLQQFKKIQASAQWAAIRNEWAAGAAAVSA